MTTIAVMESPYKKRNIIFNLKNITAMKNFIEILTNEEKSFNVDGKWFIILTPIVLIALMGLAGYFDTHGM
jgi:hypothetical protein